MDHAQVYIFFQYDYKILKTFLTPPPKKKIAIRAIFLYIQVHSCPSSVIEYTFCHDCCFHILLGSRILQFFFRKCDKMNNYLLMVNRCLPIPLICIHFIFFYNFILPFKPQHVCNMNKNHFVQ